MVLTALLMISCARMVGSPPPPAFCSPPASVLLPLLDEMKSLLAEGGDEPSTSDCLVVVVGAECVLNVG